MRNLSSSIRFESPENQEREMNEHQILAEQLAIHMTDTSAADLMKLKVSELREIDEVDTNWCFDEVERNKYATSPVSERQAVSTALTAMYEEIVNRERT